MTKRAKMQDTHIDCAPLSLLQLPDTALVEVLRNLDATSLVNLEQTNSYWDRKDPLTRLPLCEHIAQEQVMKECGTLEQAKRLRNRSWKERLFIERNAGCGFDKEFCEEAGFRLQTSNVPSLPDTIRLTGMGPKLLLSDVSTKEQPVLHWRLRVKGNTAVEFGVIPVGMQPAHTALHKCLSIAGAPHQRCVGFCSQITAGSLLPLKAPVMRGTMVDIIARRGHIEVVLMYPEDAKEIHWQNGQPIQRPYRGPSQLRFEQDFADDHDVRLAVTSWAKASFDILHTPAGHSNWESHAVPQAAVDEQVLPEEEAVATVAQAAAALQQQLIHDAVAQLPAASIDAEQKMEGLEEEAGSDVEPEQQTDESLGSSGEHSGSFGISSRSSSIDMESPTSGGVGPSSTLNHADSRGTLCRDGQL